MRTFDPVRIGRLETVAWVAYYRREWLKFLRAAVGLTYEAFRVHSGCCCISALVANVPMGCGANDIIF